jgi:hypothetical protein
MRFVARREWWFSSLLAALVFGVALHQFITSRDGVLSPWKGGGFGMYTTPHATVERATFLTVDGKSLRLSPPDPALTEWIDSADPVSARFLRNMVRAAGTMRNYPRAAQADQLMRQGARVVWEKELFDSLTDVGRQPATAMSVTVMEIARRPSAGVLETRVVFEHAGD